jgi:hypothetical protein
MQEEEDFYYNVVCSACLRHLYKPPKHYKLIGCFFVPLCSDACLKTYSYLIGGRAPRLTTLCINAIVENPELYDISLLPDECKKRSSKE